MGGTGLSHGSEKKVHVVVRCIQCGNKRKVYAGEVPKGDMPECEVCFGIMVPVKAASR